MTGVPKYSIFLGWLKEVFFLLLFLLHIPIGFFLRIRPKILSDAIPVVIVPDILTNLLFYLRLRRRLIKQGYSVYMFRSVSLFKSISAHSQKLSNYLEKWDIKNGVLICHGAGGLSALSLPDTGRRRIQHLLTLSTPFNGSKIFKYLGFIPAFRDIAVESEFLLMNRVNALMFPVFSPFSSWQDEWITPFSAARFGQGKDLILDKVGHYNLLLSGEILDTVISYLGETCAKQYPEKTFVSKSAKQELETKDVSERKTMTAHTNKKKKITRKTQSRKKAVKKKTVKKSAKKTAKKTTRETGKRAAKK